MGLPAGKKTKTGYSTAADVLEELAEQYPFVKNILEYRSLSKLISTYLEALPLLIRKETGRIHTTFNQTVTATGRLSSSDPNLQNIPVRTEEGKKIRSLFVPGEGYDSFISSDYSQVELRVLAHMSEDEGLIRAFLNKEDIHRRTAAEVMGIPFEDVTPEQRSHAKPSTSASSMASAISALRASSASQGRLLPTISRHILKDTRASMRS